MPRTIRRKKSPLRQTVQQRSLPRVEVIDYFPPEHDPERELIRDKLGQPRRKKMGEAKEIVGKPYDDHFPAPVGVAAGSVIQRMSLMVDDIDRAIQVKEHDLSVEGKNNFAENHYKIGILKGADSLIRRARAMLQDYGTDLDQDFDPSEDIKAASGEDLENGVVIPLNSDKKEYDPIPIMENVEEEDEEDGKDDKGGDGGSFKF